MPQITLNIPENKLTIFLEMMGNIGFVKENNAELFVPEFHKEIVRKRILKAQKDKTQMLKWEDVQKLIRTE